MADSFSQEVPALLQSHLDHLLKSAISLDVIKARGYRSVMGSSPELVTLGFSKAQRRRPAGILIPMYGANGHGVISYQYRPDNPRKSTKDDGTTRDIKYETPAGAEVHFDINPRTKENAGNPQVPCWITEGIKKGDALVTAGAEFVISLIGVWNWRGKNKHGGKVAIPDFEYVAWNGRKVYLCFDSDAWSNAAVADALSRLSALLKRRGAELRVLKLPAGADGAKTGADDYLAQGHTLQELIGLETAEDVRPAPRKKLDIFGAPYNVAEGVLTFEKYDQYGSVDPVPLGNFIAGISEIIEKDNGKDIGKYFKIVGREATGRPLPEVIVPCKEFETLNWVVENWDVRAAISADRSAKARIREALLLLSYNAQRKSVYAHTGWREFNGRRTFLTCGGAIGMPEVLVDMEDEDLAEYSLPQPVEDPREALRASFDYLKLGNREVLLPLWAAMYMTVLNEFVTPAFTLFTEGLSGSYKSGITALALNHFGKGFNYDRLPASWFYSENRLEQMLFTLKDLPLVIDDFAPAKDIRKAKEMEQMADRIVRNQANRSGRGRMKSDISSRKTYKPRGFLITSGEHLPGTYSAAARMYVVEVRKGDIDRVQFFQALERKALYSQAMTQYIVWIIRNWDKLRAELPHQVQKWTTQALDQDAAQHARMPGAVATLYAGLSTALTFFTESGVVPAGEAEALCKEGWQTFIKQSMEQSERVSQERPGKRFLQLLNSLKDQGRAVFGSTEDTEPHTPAPGQTFVGWSDKEAWYLEPDAAYSAVRKYADYTDAPFTIKEDAVWRDIHELGYSVCSEGRFKYRKDIYGRKMWLIRLKAEIL